MNRAFIQAAACAVLMTAASASNANDPIPPAAASELPNPHAPMQPAPMVSERNAIETLSFCRDIVLSPKSQEILETDAECRLLLSSAKNYCTDPLGKFPAPTNAQLRALTSSVSGISMDCSEARIKSLAAAGGDQIGAAGIGTLAWQDTLIRGAASFVESRFEAELALMLQQQMTEDVCKGKTGQNVLPGTCNILSLAKDKLGSPSWGPLKSALERDLEAMPIRLFEQILQPYAPTDSTHAFVTVVQVVRELEQNGQVAEVLAGLEVKYAAADCKKQDVGCTLRLLGRIAAIVGRDLGSSLTTQDQELFAKLALDAASDAFPSLALNDPSKLEARKRAVIRLRKQLETANSLAKSAAKLEKESYEERLRAFSAYVRAVVPMVPATIVLLTGEENPQPCKDGEITCLGLIADATTAAVDATEAIRGKNYVAGAVTLLAMAQRAGITKDKLPHWVTQHLMFVVELASASNADAVEKVLQNAAAPVGSYKLKRKHGNGSVHVTAFAGAQAGREWLLDKSNKLSPQSVGHVGFFAPVGVDFTIGLNDAFSVGVFVPVIDLGALTDFRLGQGSTEEGTSVDPAPQIGFGQVFSPGAYIVLGLGKTPFSIGGGVSLSPRLRQLTVDSRTTEASAVRLNGFVALDLTLFPLLR